MDKFKKVCQKSATKQREELEFRNVKRGRKDETVDMSPSVVLAPIKEDQNIGQSCVTGSLEGSLQSIAPKPWIFNTIPNALWSNNCPRPNAIGSAIRKQPRILPANLAKTLPSLKS